MIELQNLSKTFQSIGKTVTAVNDVSRCCPSSNNLRPAKALESWAMAKSLVGTGSSVSHIKMEPLG